MVKIKKLVILHSKLLSIFFTLFIFFLGLFIFFYTQSIPYIPKTPSEKENFKAATEKEKWKVYMQHMGPKKAYADFKHEYMHVVFTRQHIAMHAIGELLYETDGIDGLPVCDDTFAFGCYHGFFGAAINDRGMSDLKMMDEACIKKFGLYGTGCQHGMGHGMMAYLGNDKLLEGLKGCDSLQRRTPLGGCNSGIFMEYNFHTIRHDENPKARKLDRSDPYFPCNTVPVAYQHACYYAQPEWWNTVYGKNPQKIGELCEPLEESNRTICYLGTGVIAGQTTYYSTTDTIRYCNSIAYENGRMLCKSGASWVYKISKQHLKQIHKICESEPIERQATCVEKSQAIQ